MQNLIQNTAGLVALASQSPRRLELLAQIGIKAHVVNVDVPECLAEGETPINYVSRLARAKSQAGADKIQHESALACLGADTIVVLNDDVLEKPKNKAHAIDMLCTLGGNTHQVLTAVACTHGKRQSLKVSRTAVTFKPISAAQAETYWQTGEPQDKAGGYGIQGVGAIFVSHINGSFSGVVGLPLFETHQLLTEFNLI